MWLKRKTYTIRKMLNNGRFRFVREYLWVI